MINFTLKDFNSDTKLKLRKLCREDKCYYDDFIDEIKSDNNLKPELGDLWAILKNVANGKQVPKTKYRKENLGKKIPFTVYAVKSDHLRLYVFTDSNGMIVILGGKKTEQDEDLKRSKKVVKEYSEFLTKKEG